MAEVDIPCSFITGGILQLKMELNESMCYHFNKYIFKDWVMIDFDKMLESDLSKTTLDITNNEFSVAEMSHLIQALSKHPRINALYFDNCTLSDEVMGNFSEHLRKNTTIKSLDFNESTLSMKGLTELVQNLADNSSLNDLGLFNLSFINPVEKIEKYGLFDALSSTLVKNKTLKALSLEGFSLFNDSYVQKLADALGQNCALEKLYLTRCSISASGYKCIAEALFKNSHLIELNLSHNGTLYGHGFKAFLKALDPYKLEKTKPQYYDFMSKLQVLNLNGCDIGKLDADPEETKLMIGALKRLKLSVLEISACRLAKKDLDGICTALMQNKSIRVLDLSKNPIQSDMVINFSEHALSNNKVLSNLNIQGNQFSDKAVEAIKTAIKSNGVTTRLLMDNGDAELQLIMQVNISRLVGDQMNIILTKVRKIDSKKHTKAYAAGMDLHQEIERNLLKYMADEITIETFVDNSMTAIEIAKKSELATHRGWKKILYNLGLFIAGAGVGYFIAATANYINTKGAHFFFPINTDSINKVEQFEKVINSIKPRS